MSDSIDGAFYVLVTEDGGAHWGRVDASGLPAALPGEGYFAASGTNVATWGVEHAGPDAWAAGNTGLIARWRIRTP